MKTTLRAASLLAIGIWLTAGPVAFAQGLPTAKPEQVGLSSARLAAITETLRKNIAAGEIPGAVLLIARQGKIAYFESLGMLDPQAKTPMRKDALFRIYSMSKPITTVAAMMLFEDAAFTLADPVGQYLPPLAKMQVAADNKPDSDADPSNLTLVPASRPISIHDLMRHTSGLTYGFFGNTPVKKLYAQAKLGAFPGTNAEFVERIATLPLSYQPGTTWDYSHSTDVLGRLVEVISGKSLYAFEKERILDPLGMRDTSFYVTDATKQPRIAELRPAGCRKMGVGRRRHDVERDRLCALSSAAVERRHARRQTPPRAEDRRLHGQRPYRDRHRAGTVLSARAGLRLWPRVRRAARCRHPAGQRLGRRLQLGRRRWHRVLGRPQGADACRLHDAGTLAANPLSGDRARHGLRRHRPGCIAAPIGRTSTKR